MVLSIEERVFLVEHIFQEGSRYTDLVQEQFAEISPETPVPHHKAFRGLIEKFREKGSVFDAERNVWPSRLNDEKLLDISDATLRCPSKCLLKLAQEGGFGLATAHKAVRKQLELLKKQ
jgi:hypothetical protein